MRSANSYPKICPARLVGGRLIEERGTYPIRFSVDYPDRDLNRLPRSFVCSR
jgi:hypothetical protein